MSFTFGIFDSLYGVIRIVGINLNVDEPSDMFRDLELQFDHLLKHRLGECQHYFSENTYRNLYK